MWKIVDSNELQKTRRAEKLDKIEGNWNGNRQKKFDEQQQFIRWVSLLIKVTVVVAIVFHFRNIYAYLEEIQVKLERFEIQQYGKMQTNVDTKIADESSDVD